MVQWHRRGCMLFLAGFAVIVAGPAPRARAYIDLAATLPRIIQDSQRISVVEVVEFRRERRGLVLKEVRALKGELSADPIRHLVASGENGTVPRPILTWAAPGARAVMFASRDTTLICLGEGWYQVTRTRAGPWQLGADRPDLPLAYHGSLSRLTDGVERMLAGKDAVLTVVAYGVDHEGSSFDLALNRPAIPGLVRVQRIRANTSMPAMVMAASANPSYLLGAGPVAVADVPALTAKLKSPDAIVRAEAADDLRSLGLQSAPATAALTALLEDASARVRCSAAAALLQIDSRSVRPLDVLSQALGARDSADRRAAAVAVGSCGSAAAPIVEKLAARLKDEDEGVRISALLALSRLGSTAGPASGAVAGLLDTRELVVDAADALGRMGPAARTALPRLAKLLADDEATIRWAAIRAMSQIGGDGARPAVEFMMRTLPRSPEVDRYNMMIYLALLGPVAKDAIPVIRTSGSRNPVLGSVTIWAIEPDKSLPWQGRGGFGPPGPPFGGGGENFATLIYENYVHELGDRLRPAAVLLAKNIVAGTAGDVPRWGYRLLSIAPEEAIRTLSPSLSHRELAMRERAVVALGYMGSAARPAADAVKAALAAAENEREKRLIAWCLREIVKE